MPTHSDMIHQPKFWKTFLIFLVPLIVTNILQNLSGTINTIYVGQMLGVDAIAAISVFFPILFAIDLLRKSLLQVYPVYECSN